MSKVSLQIRISYMRDNSADSARGEHSDDVNEVRESVWNYV